MAIFGCWREKPRLSKAEIALAWAALHPAFKEPWIVCAREAIEAMREPSAAMKHAFENHEGLFCGLGYEALIDVVLSESRR